MAQVSIVKAFVLAVLIAAVAVSVSAQALSTAPAPSPDAGSASSLTVSGAVIGASILFYAVALLRI